MLRVRASSLLVVFIMQDIRLAKTETGSQIETGTIGNLAVLGGPLGTVRRDRAGENR